jgi:hypothetical protein
MKSFFNDIYNGRQSTTVQPEENPQHGQFFETYPPCRHRQ